MSEEKKKRGRKKKLDRIDRMCLYCADYNAKHGTNYSYGEFVAQIAARKIKPLGLYDYANQEEKKMIEESDLVESEKIDIKSNKA